MIFWIKIEVTETCILLIFKFKQYKNANIANFVYYGKTRIESFKTTLSQMWEN